jgi:peroxiredoxin
MLSTKEKDEIHPMVRTASTMLPLGTKAPNFSLTNIDGRTVSLPDFVGKKALVVIFMCNHCPYVKHVAPELARVAKDYLLKGVGIVGISSNDIVAHPDDRPEMMKVEAAKQGYPFPYLYDADQSIAIAYNAACTPDIFVFDETHRLVYRGQLDDSRPKNGIPLSGKDLRSALDCILAGQPVSAEQRPSIGCNIKWKEGSEPVYFNPAGTA